MTARTVTANGLAWRFAPDEPPPLAAERSQAMLQARLVDEVLNAPPQLPLRATTAVHGAIGRATDGGRVGVVGRPAQAFFAPTVALARMDLIVAATGFLPLALESAVGPQPGYPAVFTAVDLGDIALHRRHPHRRAGGFAQHRAARRRDRHDHRGLAGASASAGGRHRTQRHARPRRATPTGRRAARCAGAT